MKAIPKATGLSRTFWRQPTPPAMDARMTTVSFAKWTPGKIRTSSFGAAFVTREFSIKVDEGTANGRLDLFLVDPANKILVAIENKVKASLTVQQLEKYVRAVKGQISNRRVFADYDLAFIVLDQDLESYKERQLLELGKRWVLLDYRWLEASASRARFQLSRGNNSAQLLIAYCQSVTRWQSPTSEKNLGPCSGSGPDSSDCGQCNALVER